MPTSAPRIILIILVAVLFFAFVYYTITEKQRECKHESRVIEIVGVKYRDVKVRTEDGSQVTINQPPDLRVGDRICLQY